MKKSICIIFCLLIIHITFGQDLEKKGDLMVINILGAKVYEQPSFNSKVLQELAVGEYLSIENSIASKEGYKVARDFFLPGKWIKPKGINGYVFSTDLSDKKAEISTDEFGQTKINLLGKLNSKKSEIKQVNIGKEVISIPTEIKVYENGTYTSGYWDGCFNHSTIYKNLNQSEVYHQMVCDYYELKGDKKPLIPIFQGQEGKVLKFEAGGAVQDLKIEIGDKGLIKVSSYDCT